MSALRFEELLGRWLDDQLDDQELSELVQLAQQDPHRGQELQQQLEAAELLAQSEDVLRDSPRFLATVQSRLGDEPFLTNVRSAMTRQDWRRWRIGFQIALSLVLAVAVFAGGVYSWRPQEKPTIARLAEFNGAVQWTGDGGQVERDLEVGQEFRGGTLESFGSDAWARLCFHDGSTATISGQATLTISEQQRKELHLREGRLSANVAPQPADRSLLIHTPTAELEVLGTEFDVNAEPAATILAVHQGSVRIKRLADGRVLEARSGRQVVAAACREVPFQADRRPCSVNTWRSEPPCDVKYGQWTPEIGGVRASPLLWRCRAKRLVLYLTALEVYPGDHPVILPKGGKFRVRGWMGSPQDVYFGVDLNHAQGSFAGKYVVNCPAKSFAGGEFELELSIDDFVPRKKQFPESPVGLELTEWWCCAIRTDPGLIVFDVELVSE